MVPRLLQWFVKNGLYAAMAGVLAACVGLFSWIGYTKFSGETKKQKDLAVSYAKLKTDHDALTRKYADLEADRNNVLEQTKTLLAEHSKFSELQEAFEELKRNDQILIGQKDKLLAQSERFKKERDSLIASFEKLKAYSEKLQSEHKALESQQNSLQKQLVDKVENSPAYRSASAEIKKLKAENAKLSATIKTLEGKLKQALDRLKKLSQRELAMKRQIMNSEKGLKKLKTESAKLQSANRGMNQMVQQVPGKFARIAQENKQLVKETADMHYNLGVFFTQHKNYTMAVKEFERAVALNPDNPKSHYNLGYLYSEELERHPDAMAHFERFLEIDPNAKESEAVRAYLLTRQTVGDRPAKTR